jgi:putative acetyltransferase
MEINIRTIQPADNPFIARIVKNVLAEFGANHPHTVYDDPRTDILYEIFQQEGSGYFIAVRDDKIIGGGGIYPTEGLPAGTCELVKMYLLPEGRGLGLGRRMIEKCLQLAVEKGYDQVYLETMPELKQALSVYEKFGFKYLSGPMGNSGHTGCSLWMLKKMKPAV